MKMKLIALRDIKANTFMPPWAVPNVNVALREMGEVVNLEGNEKPSWAKWPEDHELYELGEFETEDGSFFTWNKDDNPKTQLCLLSTLKK